MSDEKTDTPAAKEPHYCHAIGCVREVPPRLFMCRAHWFMVPEGLRRAIWRCYRPGQEIDKRPSTEYLHVAQAAIAAVAAAELDAQLRAEGSGGLFADTPPIGDVPHPDDKPQEKRS